MADLIDRDGVLARIDCCLGNSLGGRKEFDSGLLQARKFVINTPAVNRWIPCSERLPEQEDRILLFAAGEVYVGEFTDIKDLYVTDIGFMKSGHVTHWMPLPEPPKEG